MTRPTECRCIHYLLLVWLLFLTASQVVFLTLYYTAGEHNRAQGEVTPQPTTDIKDNPKPPVKENKTESFSGKMITLEASKVDHQGCIQWRTRRADPSLVSVTEEVLTLQQDAYYFLCLTVTLNKGAHAEKGGRVTLKRNDNVILEGSVHEGTLSTGPLAKVEDMSGGDTLVITVTSQATVDMTSPTKTNLGIICLPKTPPIKKQEKK